MFPPDAAAGFGPGLQADIDSGNLGRLKTEYTQ
jgi:hypothetical protein